MVCGRIVVIVGFMISVVDICLVVLDVEVVLLIVFGQVFFYDLWLGDMLLIVDGLFFQQLLV